MGKAGKAPVHVGKQLRGEGGGLHNRDVIKGVRINKHGSMSSSSSSDH